MGYANEGVFVGKDHDGIDTLGGFRFTVNVDHGVTLTHAQLRLYLGRMYPASSVQDVLDRFVDTSGTGLEVHTMDIGPVTGWVKHTAGTIDIQNGQAQQVSVNTDCVYTTDVGVADGIVRSNTYPHSDGCENGIIFRLSDNENYWRFYYNLSQGKLYLKKRVAGVETSYNVSKYWIRGHSAVLDGDNIKCYAYDYHAGTWSLYFDKTDSDLNTNTRHGLHGRSTSARRARWFDFEFIPAGTPDPLLWARCDDVDDSEPFCEKMDFDSGSVEFTVTETVTGASSGATGVVNGYDVDSGTWGAGTAAGTVYLTSVTGAFTNNEALNGSVGGNDVATADGVNSENLPDARTLTTNTISLGDISGWTEDGWNYTTDIKSPIQEVLDRAGWASGNDLSVILTPQPTENDGSRIRVKSYEGYPSLAAQLYLYWGNTFGKVEYYDAGTILMMFGSTTWLAQGFTPSLSHVIQSVRVYLDRDAACGTVTVEIYATSGGAPTGSALASGTKAEGDIPTAGGWVCFDLSSGVGVTKSTMYAIVVRADGDASSIGWMHTVNEPPNGDPYSGGEMQISTDSGASWTDVADIGHPAGSYADADFEEWTSVCSH